MTKPIRLALLGDPVAHSRSPRIHRAALAAAGLEGDYVAIRADEAVLDRYLEDLRSGRLDGINITMPLKAAAARRADELTVLAGRADSVNTLRFRDARIEAHSTDAVAFREILEEEAFAGDRSVLILGSGGSARAALAAISGRPVYVSARNTDKAEALADRLGATGVVPWGSAVADTIVINATPIGMRGERLDDDLLATAHGLIDLPYGDRKTPAIAALEAAGRPHVDGVEFLARQAGASFEWWTGVNVDYETLVAAARKA